MKRNLDRKNQQGFALITVVTLSWLLFAYLLSYVDLVTSEKRLVLGSENSAKAEALAEAAMEEVLWEYNYSSGDFQSGEGWSGTSTKTKTVSPFTDTSGKSIGNYTISVANWNTSSPLITVNSALTGAGSATQATMKSMLQPRPIYNYAFKAQNKITMSGNGNMDSYKSSQGAYSSSNKYQNGSAGTNSNATPAISVNGNGKIKGNANTGSSGTVSVTGNGGVTGAISNTMSETFTVNTVPSTLTILPNLGAVPAGTTLVSGLYKYTNISLTSNSGVTVSGDVTLYLTGSATSISIAGNGGISLTSGSKLTVYLDGNIAMSGNGGIFNGGSATPQSVQLIGTPTCTSVAISGNGNVVGLVNAPSAGVAISGNGSFFGSVIGNTFSGNGNGSIHYDEDLATNGPSSGLKLQWNRRLS